MVGVVECRSDYEYAQRPVAFTWQGQRLEVREIINTWRAPLGKHFRVLADDQNTYTLIYQEAYDQWSVEIYEQPTNPNLSRRTHE
jgi:hypothetical protein